MSPPKQPSRGGTPPKRKRGRPRKDESAVRGDNSPVPVPVLPAPDNIFNSYQAGASGSSNQAAASAASNQAVASAASNQVAAGSTGDCDNEMIGKVVTGVIEASFKSGYLLNVKVADTDTELRGLVFVPGGVVQVTAENDVAPHAPMIQRQSIPIPILNPQTEPHGSVPSSAQCSQPELQVPSSGQQLFPTAIHSSTSASIEDQMSPVNLPMNETSISSGGIPQLEHGLGYQFGYVSQLERVPSVGQCDETLNEPDASTQEKESSADGGPAKDIGPEFQPTTLAPTTENMDTELITGEMAAPPALKLNEPTHEGTNTSNIERNQIPGSSEPESTPSEQVDNPVDYFVERDTTVGQCDETLNEFDATTQVKESSADVGAAEDSGPEFQPTSLAPTTENTDMELITGDMAAPPGLKLNEPTDEGTNTSNIELNQILGSFEPESPPSEQVNNPVDYFVEKQASPKTDVLEDTKTKLGTEISSKVDPSDTNGKPNTSLEVGSSHAHETGQPESMSGGSFDAVGTVDVNQLTEPSVYSVEPENQN